MDIVMSNSCHWIEFLSKRQVVPVFLYVQSCIIYLKMQLTNNDVLPTRIIDIGFIPKASCGHFRDFCQHCNVKQQCIIGWSRIVVRIQWVNAQENILYMLTFFNTLGDLMHHQIALLWLKLFPRCHMETCGICHMFFLFASSRSICTSDLLLISDTFEMSVVFHIAFAIHQACTLTYKMLLHIGKLGLNWAKHACTSTKGLVPLVAMKQTSVCVCVCVGVVLESSVALLGFSPWREQDLGEQDFGEKQ